MYVSEEKLATLRAMPLAPEDLARLTTDPTVRAASPRRPPTTLAKHACSLSPGTRAGLAPRGWFAAALRLC